MKVVGQQTVTLAITTVTQKRLLPVSYSQTCLANQAGLKKWTFAASVEMRPFLDNSGIVLFDQFASQTHLLRFVPDLQSIPDFSAPFTSDDINTCFGSENGTLNILVGRNLVVPLEH